MTKMTQHKMEQRKHLTNINMKLCMMKHIFSEEFSNVLHEFSKEHHREQIKTFRESWKTWISNDDIQIKIKEEMEKMRKSNVMWTDGEIMQKIYTSARFYYRKKEKQTNKTNEKTNEKKQPKPYIGFTKDFIKLIDNNIKEHVLQKTETETTVTLDQKQIFHKFALEHTEEINEELGKLKQKYDEMNATFEPHDIAAKCKKVFTNRFYLTSKILQKNNQNT